MGDPEHWEAISGQNGLTGFNLLPNSTWRLGKGDWVYSANYFNLTNAESDKPDSPILQCTDYSSTSGGYAWIKPSSNYIKAGTTYTLAWDYKTPNYVKNTLVVVIRLTSHNGSSVAPDSSQSIWQKSIYTKNLDILSSTDNFARYVV